MEDRKSDMIYYLIGAFGIPCVCVTLIKYIPLCQNGILNLLIYGIEAASPAIAAILTVLHTNKVKGLKQFISQKYTKSFNYKYGVIAFFAPALLLTCAKILTYVTPYHNALITLSSAKKIIIILWALIAEELGWRGYLQEQIELIMSRKLNTNLSASFTPLMIGVIWALWHYHFWISGSMEVPIWLFVYSCIAESYGYYIITKLSNGNIIPASIWHFSGNLFFNLYLFNPNWNQGSMVPYLLTDVFYSVCMIGFILCKKYIIRTKEGIENEQAMV